MAVFVYDQALGVMVDKVTREPMNDPLAPFTPSTPMVTHDIAPYISPASGKLIGGRRAMQDDLARTNCIDGRDIPSPTGGKIRSERILKKYNLPEKLLKG